MATPPKIRSSSHAGLDQKSKRFVVYCAVSVSSIIALVVIGVVAIMPLVRTGFEIPEVLANWGGLIIGFYFGSFVTLLKDWSQESVDVHREKDE